MNFCHVVILVTITLSRCRPGVSQIPDKITHLNLPYKCNQEHGSESYNEVEVVDDSETPQLLTDSKIINAYKENDNQDLLLEEDNLFISTLEGSLFAVSKRNGLLQWQIKGGLHDCDYDFTLKNLPYPSTEEPIVKVPWDPSSKNIMPIILPDPKDGSLYFVDERNSNILKKLPFTMSELVAASPYKANDGFLYLGKKSDTWYSMDPYTGETFDTITMDGRRNVCPFSARRTIYFGKTEYNVMMFDDKNKRQWWNVTYFDYSATPMTKEIAKDYNMVHFGASSMGFLLTLDKKTSSVVWKRDFGSPIVGIYFLKQDSLVKVPFTSLSLDTLNHLEARLSDINFKKESMNENSEQLFPTLYIGKHRFGLYALPSLVDGGVNHLYLTNQLLIDGPSNAQKDNVISGDYSDPEQADVKVDFILLGYHKLPINPDYWSQSLLRITYEENETQYPNKNFIFHKENAPIHNPSTGHEGVLPHTLFYDGLTKVTAANTTFIFSSEFISWTFSGLALFYTQDQLFFKVVIIVLLTMMTFMLKSVYPKIREYEKAASSRHSNMSTSSDFAGSQITAESEDLGDNKIQIGRIVFNVGHVLGKGCEGTFVYKGWFDRRDVAVKRLLPECFTVADREVDILRESDAHPNVVRYFCMEQDRQFRYIALELCAYNLQHYVERITDKDTLITPMEVLMQSTAGLAHLHSLNIVHRDIKPQNVLLSYPDARGQIRVMISDFGLCKKLNLGKISFSKKSGFAGTDGWIAPEMLEGSRTTCMVDIFSLGCVFYYVLSNGSHPFGDSLRRQANILSHYYNLSELDSEQNSLLHDLIGKMISKDPSIRPPANSILKHPAFWKQDTVLRFFQDVSDRVEKESMESAILQRLESNARDVVKGDWRDHIDETVALSLRKYRAYKGRSVRDLLRALRNKKHHYHELSEEARLVLGRIPDEFVCYWTTKFPRLLLHTWYALQLIKTEPICRPYYDLQFDFYNRIPIKHSWRWSSKAGSDSSKPEPKWTYSDPFHDEIQTGDPCAIFVPNDQDNDALPQRGIFPNRYQEPCSEYLSVTNHSCLSVQWQNGKPGKRKKKNPSISKAEID